MEPHVRSPARWRDVRALFDALANEAPAVRDARLREVQGHDAHLAADVAAMLAAHAVAGRFLESPVIEMALTCSGAADEVAAHPPADAVIGEVVSHYRLEEWLGTGGMGVVYKARDIALGREAALKLLAGRSTPDLQDRLRSEAIACARLQHPAIATFFESGESHGRAFIAMEYVAGTTLRSRLGNGALAVEEATAIAASVLAALSHAHAAGVLHRDIKPENIVMTADGAVKLLDFGIAKLLFDVDGQTMAHLTGTAILGTVGYMSPEQIRNDPLDARSDVFQVAALLYEMLSGEPAFPGRTAAERLAAILTKDPPPFERAGVSDALQTVLFRALSRDAAGRFPSASGFLSALQRAAGEGALASLPNSLAVVDLHNLGEAADDWIATGMTESLADELGRVSRLRLIRGERVSAAVKSTQAGDVEGAAIGVGLAVGSRWVLSGTYRRLGQALRVTILLVEASTSRVVARQAYDGTVEQIFVLQDRIVAAIREWLATDGGFTAPPAHPQLSAYECYAKGRRLAVSNDRAAIHQARELFEAAVDIDPTYARALAGLARVLALSYTFTNDIASLRTAVGYADRAIAADPRSAEAHVWRGYAFARLGQDEDAASSFERARSLDPADVYGFYFAGGRNWRRDPDRVSVHLQRAIALDPKFGSAWWGMACIYTSLGRYLEALSCFERCALLVDIADARPFPGVQAYWAECLRLMGRLQEAREKALEGLDVIERTDYMYRDTNRVFALVTLGRTAIAQGDAPAAVAAFEQAGEHVNGRPRTLAGGTLLVRAEAGLAQVTRDTRLYQAACHRMSRRTAFNYTWLWLCDDYLTWAMLADVAHALGRHDDARAFFTNAVAGGPSVH
jgi:serine/threonine-protein kinase